MPGFRRLGQIISFGSPFRRFGGGNVRRGFNWNQNATFEAGLASPYPTGFDSTDGPNITVEAAAAMRGNYGIRFSIPDANARIGEFDQLDNEAEVTFETLLDISALTMGAGENFVFSNFFTTKPNLMVQFRLIYNGVNFSLQTRAQDDLGGTTIAAGLLIPHTGQLRVLAKVSDYDGADNGYLFTYWNGVEISRIEGIDNDTLFMNSIDIGAGNGLDAGTSGQIDLDNPRWSDRIVYR